MITYKIWDEKAQKYVAVHGGRKTSWRCWPKVALDKMSKEEKEHLIIHKFEAVKTQELTVNRVEIEQAF